MTKKINLYKYYRKYNNKYNNINQVRRPWIKKTFNEFRNNILSRKGNIDLKYIFKKSLKYLDASKRIKKFYKYKRRAPKDREFLLNNFYYQERGRRLLFYDLRRCLLKKGFLKLLSRGILKKKLGSIKRGLIYSSVRVYKTSLSNRLYRALFFKHYYDVPKGFKYWPKKKKRFVFFKIKTCEKRYWLQYNNIKQVDIIGLLFYFIFKFLFFLFYVNPNRKNFRVVNLFRYLNIKLFKNFLSERTSIYSFNKKSFSFIINKLLGQIKIISRPLFFLNVFYMNNKKIHPNIFSINRSLRFLALFYKNKWSNSGDILYKRLPVYKSYGKRKWGSYYRLTHLLKYKRFKFKDFVKLPNLMRSYWMRKHINSLYFLGYYLVRNSFFMSFYMTIAERYIKVKNAVNKNELSILIDEFNELLANKILKGSIRQVLFQNLKKRNNRFIFFLGLIGSSFYHKGFRQYFLSYETGWKNVFNAPLMVTLTANNFNKNLEKYYYRRKDRLGLDQLKYISFFKNELRRIKHKIFRIKRKRIRFKKARIKPYREVLTIKYRPKNYIKTKPRLLRLVRQKYKLGSVFSHSRRTINLLFSNLYSSMVINYIGGYGLIHFRGLNRFLRGKFWSGKRVASYYFKQKFIKFFQKKISKKEVLTIRFFRKLNNNFVYKNLLIRFIKFLEDRVNFVQKLEYRTLGLMELDLIQVFVLIRIIFYFLFYYLSFKVAFKKLAYNIVMQCHS